MTYRTCQMSVCLSIGAYICPCVRPSLWCQHFQNPKAPRPLGWYRWQLHVIFYVSRELLLGTRILNFTPAPNLPRSIFAIPYTALYSCEYAASKQCHGILRRENPSEELDARKFPASHRRKQSEWERWPIPSGLIILTTVFDVDWIIR